MLNYHVEKYSGISKQPILQEIIFKKLYKKNLKNIADNYNELRHKLRQ